MPAVTNKQLSKLLIDLGFERAELTEKDNRFWKHPLGTVLVLPNNKIDQAATEADLATVEAHLDNMGHLSKDAFASFRESGTAVSTR